MISRDLTLIITDKSVSLDKSITLYRYDRGIALKIKLQSDTYDLKEEITKARAIILKPNKKVSSTEVADIVDGVFELHLDNTWTDNLGELGVYQIQLQLYGDNTDDECITIAPFSFEVKNPIGIPTDSPAYVEIASANKYSTGRAIDDAPVGDLENGKYLKTSWIGGDLITAGKLNKVETAIDYLVSDSVNHITKDEVPNLEDCATKDYVDEVVSNIEIPEQDLSNYATKDEIPTVPVNVSELNNDAGYLTEHQDVSHLALKSEIPSIEGLATETYVNEAINNIEIPEGGGNVDLSNYYTKTDMNGLLYGKADISHNHDTIYYRKYLVDAKIDALSIGSYAKLEDLTNWANQFAIKNHTHDEYLKDADFSNYATKDELNNAIGDINAILDNINGEEI